MDTTIDFKPIPKILLVNSSEFTSVASTSSASSPGLEENDTDLVINLANFLNNSPARHLVGPPLPFRTPIKSLSIGPEFCVEYLHDGNTSNASLAGMYQKQEQELKKLFEANNSKLSVDTIKNWIASGPKSDADAQKYRETVDLKIYHQFRQGFFKLTSVCVEAGDLFNVPFALLFVFRFTPKLNADVIAQTVRNYTAANHAVVSSWESPKFILIVTKNEAEEAALSESMGEMKQSFENVHHLREEGAKTFSNEAFFSGIVRAILTANEPRMFNLNQTITAQRKGFRNSLKSWLTAGAGNTLGAGGGNGFFQPEYPPPESLQYKVRLLGDFCFLLGDFESALSNYVFARDDAQTDEMHLSLARVYDLMATCCVARNKKDRVGDHVERALEFYAKHASRKKPPAHLLSRTVLLLQNVPDKQSTLLRGLIRASFEETDLFAPVLLEQAALALLHVGFARGGLRRKFAFQMVQSAGLYKGCGLTYDAMRCYCAVYAGFKAARWPLAEQHLEGQIAQLCLHASFVELGMQFRARMLQRGFSSAGNFEQKHRGLLGDLCAQLTSLARRTPGLSRVEVHLPCVVAFGGARLELDEEQPPNPRVLEMLASKQLSSFSAGDVLCVPVTFYNPLACVVEVGEARLVCREGEVEARGAGRFALASKQSLVVRVQFVGKREHSSVTVVGVEWRVLDCAVWFHFPFESPVQVRMGGFAPLVKASVARYYKDASFNASNILRLEEPSEPELEAEQDDDLIEGTIRTFRVVLENVGLREMPDSLLVCVANGAPGGLAFSCTHNAYALKEEVVSSNAKKNMLLRLTLKKPLAPGASLELVAHCRVSTLGPAHVGIKYDAARVACFTLPLPFASRRNPFSCKVELDDTAPVMLLSCAPHPRLEVVGLLTSGAHGLERFNSDTVLRAPFDAVFSVTRRGAMGFGGADNSGDAGEFELFQHRNHAYLDVTLALVLGEAQLGEVADMEVEYEKLRRELERRHELPVTIQDVRRASTGGGSSLAYLNYLQRRIKSFEVSTTPALGEVHVAALWRSGDRDFGLSFLPRVTVRPRCEVLVTAHPALDKVRLDGPLVAVEVCVRVVNDLLGRTLRGCRLRCGGEGEKDADTGFPFPCAYVGATDAALPTIEQGRLEVPWRVSAVFASPGVYLIGDIQLEWVDEESGNRLRVFPAVKNAFVRVLAAEEERDATISGFTSDDALLDSMDGTNLELEQALKANVSSYSINEEDEEILKELEDMQATEKTNDT